MRRSITASHVIKIVIPLMITVSKSIITIKSKTKEVQLVSFFNFKVIFATQ